jgi:AAA+ ATPase superfamily predicted ATPase
VIDELPYLVATSPELPSVLQRWIDHDARRARLQVALAGSSQRVMQGLVLGGDAPLYGRAKITLDVQPLAAAYMRSALGRLDPAALIEHWTAWGGIPRYWELAAERRGSARARLLALAFDPMGPLFAEPERLLLEESPPAQEVRPVLDAIGAGCHRLSEIAGRIGRPATSLARPLDRLLGMGLVRREVPYGEPERGGKRSLYKIADPFLRVWFGVVAPNRAALISGTAASRAALLETQWRRLVGEAWEDLCRISVPRLRRGIRGPWRPSFRYWQGSEPEWDLVADAVDDRRVLLGEAWFHDRPLTAAIATREAHRLASRPPPAPAAGRDLVRALFVPALAAGVARSIAGAHMVTLADLLIE